MPKVLFPRWAALDRADVFWSPRHRVPLRMPTPSVVTIHDMVWKHAPETMRRLGIPPRARDDAAYDQAGHPRYHRIARDPVLHRTLLSRGGRQDYGRAPGIVRDGIRDRGHLLAPTFRSLCRTVEPRKNLQRLLAAFARIRNDVEHDLHLVGGSGWRMPKASSLIRANGLESRVHALGALEDGDLLRQYAGCDFVAMPRPL